MQCVLFTTTNVKRKPSVHEKVPLWVQFFVFTFINFMRFTRWSIDKLRCNLISKVSTIVLF